jgi:uncharacterized protein YcnI
MIKRIAAIAAIASLIVGLNAGIASAHVVVKPAQVETAAFQSFTTGVPNEKSVPTTKVRLVIPEGLGHVMPNVKPGWTVETVKEGTGDDTVVKEIIWSGGQVPAGQRDDFVFSAQAPESATTLQWKAYQTYADGEEVAWDQEPAEDGHGAGDVKPYSQTEVVEEAGTATAASTGADDSAKTRTSVAIGLSVVAIILSVVAITKRRS